MPSFGFLDHPVADIVDKVHVVAGTAEHDVGTALAVEQVAASVAIDLSASLLP